MNNEFGDIALFNKAIAIDRLDPPVDDYLRSTGLSDSEIAEVRGLYRTFCQAIEGAFTTDLPDLAGGPQAEPDIDSSTANSGNLGVAGANRGT